MNIGVAQASENLPGRCCFSWGFFSPISMCLVYRSHFALKIVEKTFIFSMLILRCLPELAKIFQKKCLKSLEYEKKSLPLHPQNERGDAVESAPVPRKSDL